MLKICITTLMLFDIDVDIFRLHICSQLHQEHIDMLKTASNSLLKIISGENIVSMFIKRVEIGYWSSGKKRYRGEYRDNVRQGKWVSWYPSGTLWWKCNYTKGLKSGNYEEYRPNGGLKCQGLYRKEKRNGLWRFWDLNPAKLYPRRWTMYKDGVEDKLHYYIDDSGLRISSDQQPVDETTYNQFVNQLAENAAFNKSLDKETRYNVERAKREEEDRWYRNNCPLVVSKVVPKIPQNFCIHK